MTNDEFREGLLAVTSRDVNVLLEKNRDYGSSWKKRGGVGAFMMLARKWDRLENILERDFGYDVFGAWSATTMVDGEQISDTIADLRRYLLLVEQEMNRRAALYREEEMFGSQEAKEEGCGRSLCFD